MQSLYIRLTMETLFRKVLVSERVPSVSGEYDTDLKRLEYFEHLKAWRFDFKPTWWLEPVELPSEDMLPIDVMLHNNTMYHDDALQKACNNGIKMCYNYILGFINNKK